MALRPERRIGEPHRDTQVVRNVAQDARYYWRHRSVLLQRLRIRATYELGIAETNLRLLKLRIQSGAYADDTIADTESHA